MGTPKDLKGAIHNGMLAWQDGEAGMMTQEESIELHVIDFINQRLGVVMLGTKEEQKAAIKMQLLLTGVKKE